jgi:hypothetical protein
MGLDKKIAAYEAIALADHRIEGGKRFVATCGMQPKREAGDLGRRRIDVHAVNVGLQDVADESRVVLGHNLACNRLPSFAHSAPSVEQIAQSRDQEGSRTASWVHDGECFQPRNEGIDGFLLCSSRVRREAICVLIVEVPPLLAFGAFLHARPFRLRDAWLL